MHWRRAKTGTLYWSPEDGYFTWEWEILYDPE